jgi:hypothetical protein
VTTFRSTVNAFLPTIFYACNEPHGSTTLAQSGSSGAPAATVAGTPSLGFPSLLADGSGDTACYQSGNNVDLGWHIANDAAFNVAATDSFSIMAVVAAYAQQAAAFASVFGQFNCTRGAYELHVAQNGFVGTYFQDINAAGPTYDTAFPPSLNDGLPHLIGMERDHAAGTLSFWLDGRVVAIITDATTLAITNASTAQRIGCRVNCGGFFTFSGAYQDIAFFRSVLSAAAWQTLYSAMWGGNPPPPGSGITAVLGQELANAAALAELLNWVAKDLRNTP